MKDFNKKLSVFLRENMSFQTPNRSTTRPALPTLPATPESNVLSSPVASFSSPTPNYWGTPAGGLWPSTSSYMTSNSSDISTSTPARGHDTDSVNDSFNILNKTKLYSVLVIINSFFI